MDNRDFRWIAGILLLAVFGVLAYGGGAKTKAQTTQNVLVTNTSSQQVPVLPAARPGPGGAYIVAVNNAPSVKVLSSPTSSVVIKNSNDPDITGAVYSNAFTLAAGITADSSATITLSSLRTVIDSISIQGQALGAGESVDSGAVNVDDPANFTIGTFSFTFPTLLPASYDSSYMATTHIPVPAGDKVQIYAARHGGFSAACSASYTIAYHTVPNP